MSIRAIAYIRTSTKRQVLSLTCQRNSIEEWARREGAVVVAWCTDHGFSGSLRMSKRPGLAAAMDAIADDENIRVLIAASRDRLTRDTGAAGEIHAQLSLCNVQFIAADETVADSAVSRFQQNIKAAIDAHGPDAISHLRSEGVQIGGDAAGGPADHRIVAAIEAEARAVADAIPYGFRIGDGGALVADAAEQAVIANVRALRASGLSFHAIVSALQSAGVSAA